MAQRTTKQAAADDGVAGGALSTLEFITAVQPQLLGRQLPRSAVARLPLKAQLSNVCRVAVNRSMPFEFVADLADRVAATWDASLEFSYSAYDPGLATMIVDGHDLVLLWVDWRFQQHNMSAEEAVEWLKGRIAVVRKTFDGPIAVNNWPDSIALEEGNFAPTLGERSWSRRLNVVLADEVANLADSHVFDLAALAARMGDTFFDRRNDRLAGMPLSAAACGVVAQHFGGPFSCSLFQPRLKAVVVDLDNTLYAGTLGEDGLDGLVVTDTHREIIDCLLRLKRSGILLGACSKNHIDDVDALFVERHASLGISAGDFDAVRANWDFKSNNIRDIAKSFNIDVSAMLFIDDNPAELVEVATALPDIRLLHAASPANTLEQLAKWPGLYQLRPDSAATLRSTDIAANAERQRARSIADNEDEYLASLAIEISLSLNRANDAIRLSEMSQKFNQFNLGLKRMSEHDALTSLGEGYFTTTIRSRDKFSDSGLVGAVVIQVEAKTATLLEFLLSCRVLGRQLESVVFHKVLEALRNQGVETMRIDSAEGSRNEPALSWISRFTDSREVVPIETLLTISSDIASGYPAVVEWK